MPFFIVIHLHPSNWSHLMFRYTSNVMCDSPVNKSMIYVRGGLLGAFKILFFLTEKTVDFE